MRHLFPRASATPPLGGSRRRSVGLMSAAIAEPSLTLTRNIRRRRASASPVRARFAQPWRMARSGQARGYEPFSRRERMMRAALGFLADAVALISMRGLWAGGHADAHVRARRHRGAGFHAAGGRVRRGAGRSSPADPDGP